MKKTLRQRLSMASAALLLSLCSAVPAWAASISGELESVTDTAINGQVSWETSSAEPVSIEITVAREDEPEVFHTITVNGISEGEDGAPVSFSCEIDGNEFVESRYLVTAKAVSGGEQIPLSGTFLYDKEEGAGVLRDSSESSEDSDASSGESAEGDSETAGQPEDSKANDSENYVQGVYLGSFTPSASSSCSSCSGGHALTYSGTVPRANHTIAADLDLYPIGTKLMIDGVVYTVEDMGHGVDGNWLDIYFDTHEEALNYGLKTVDVYRAAEQS